MIDMGFLNYGIIFFAEYLGYALLLIFLILFFKNRRRDFLVIPLLSALISRFVFTELIRLFYFRPMPFLEQGVDSLIEHATAASFPSGHAAFFFALSAGIYYYNKKAGLWFFGGSAAIGLARIFAGVHYFTDILGGAVLGIFSFWLVDFLYKKFQ